MSADSEKTMQLSALRRGAQATVVDLDRADGKLVAKLAARGLVPGAEVSIVRAGDPLLLAVDHSRWALTEFEAGKISVVPNIAPRRSLLSKLANACLSR